MSSIITPTQMTTIMNDLTIKADSRFEKKIFKGTKEAWEALSDSDKAKYDVKYITNDTHSTSVVFSGATASADGSQGLVPKPLTGQQKSLLRGDGTWGADENLAPAFDATSAYAVGDLCTNLGKLWKCKTAISTAHAWNASEWDDVTVSEIIEEEYQIISQYTITDVTKTHEEIFNALMTGVTLPVNATIRMFRISGDSASREDFISNWHTANNVIFTTVSADSTHVFVTYDNLASSGSSRKKMTIDSNGFSVSDLSNNANTSVSGTTFYLVVAK